MFWRTFKWGLLWSLFIFIICILPVSDLPRSTFLTKIYFDKIIHAFIYMVLFFLVLKGVKTISNYPFLITIGYCLSYGLIIELIQHFLIDGRSGEFYDVIANSTGVIVGIIIVAIIKNNKTNEPLNNLGLY